MYFSFKESVSNAHCFGVFSSYNVSREGGAGVREGNCLEMLLPDSSTFMDEDVYSRYGHRNQTESQTVCLDAFEVKKVLKLDATVLTDKANQITLNYICAHFEHILYKKIISLRILCTVNSMCCRLLCLQERLGSIHFIWMNYIYNQIHLVHIPLLYSSFFILMKDSMDFN